MGFEPKVEQTIAGYRRRALRRKFAVIIPVTIVVVICSLLLIGTYAFKANIHKVLDIANKLSQPASEPVEVKRTSFYPIALILLLVFVFLGALFLSAYYYTLLKPVMKQHKFSAEDPGAYSHHRYHLFADSLEGVSIAAGINPPKLHVVKLNTANALAFEAGGKQAVGVTPEILEADLTHHEIQAVMAHQVARIKMQSGLKAPLVLTPKAIALIAGMVFILPLLTAVILKNEFIIILPLFAAPFLPLWMSLVVKPYLPWRRLTYYEAVAGAAPLYMLRKDILPDSTPAAGPGHGEALVADSLAVKITSNPDALRSAILKLIDLMESSPTMPGQTITFPYLFIGPLKEWDAPPPGVITYYLNRALVPRSAPVPDKELVAAEIRSFILTQENLLSERVNNLEAIEQGEWRQFDEVRGGRVRASYKAWNR